MELNDISKTVRSMHSGELYLCDDENLVKEQTKVPPDKKTSWGKRETV